MTYINKVWCGGFWCWLQQW